MVPTHVVEHSSPLRMRHEHYIQSNALNETLSTFCRGKLMKNTEFILYREFRFGILRGFVLFEAQQRYVKVAVPEALCCWLYVWKASLCW